jgi:outer membrane protein
MKVLMHVLALALLLVSGAKAEVVPAGAESLGLVRGDTLHVQRDKVIAAALAHNEMLAASEAMSDAADAQALSAWRGFLPRLQLGEFFMRSDDALSSFGFKLQNRGVTPLDFGMGPSGFISDNINQPGETNNHITRVQLLQPIFNGGMSWHGKGAANAASRAAAFKHRRAEETVRFHAVQAFEGLRLAQAYEKVMLAAVESARGHARQARSLVDNEMATEADLLQAQVYLSGLEQRLIEVRNMMAVAGENIKLLTAVDTPLPLAAVGDPAPSFAADVALNPDLVAQRSDIQARRQEAEAAGKMVGVATGAVLPHVNLSIQKDWYDLENLFGTEASSWTLGVFATMGFGVDDLGNIKKARAEARAARHMADFETRQARVQATQALLEVQAATEKVAVAESAVTSALEGLRIVTNQYREGLASMVDLLDTQAAATMAEGNLVQARHDLLVGVANLEFSGAIAPNHHTDTAAGGR